MSHGNGHEGADQNAPGDEHDFTGPLSPKTAKLIKIFLICSVVLFVADFFIPRTKHTSAESIPGFYALYGFAGCVVLVLVAKEMRKLVMRDEAYYDDLADAAEADPASPVSSAAGTTGKGAKR